MTDIANSVAHEKRVPHGDDPASVDLLLNQVLGRLTAAIEEVHALIASHESDAPTSSTYVAELAVIVAGETIDWLRRWPA